MHGNVIEWCLDGVSGTHDLGDETDPKGAGGRYRVLRGGGYYISGGYAQDCRSAWRSCGNPSGRSYYYGPYYEYCGFRLVVLPAVD